MNVEPTIAISFNSEELDVLNALLDVAIKSTGTKGARVALPLIYKLENAVKEYNEKNDQEVKKND
jgi:hypothetical protein